ncbi:MAG: DUF192 domain-containing protein [Rhizobiaceae bacterium]
MAFVLFAAGLLAFAETSDKRAMVLPVDPEPVMIATNAGQVRISVEIADEQEEHSRGLMFRTPLAPGHGMLFVMDYEEEQYFWMKNTPSPLDLVFASKDGTIVSIKQGEALSEASILSDKPAKYVLELAQGEAARLGLAAGNRMRHRVIP